MPEHKRVLLIAYHFPPLAGSSGIQRTLRFAQHLPSFGWQPLVLSAQSQAYEKTSNDLMAELPDNLVVRRAFALDTARHLALAGRYPGWLARPDRWTTWRFDAVRIGMQMIQRYRPQAIWSTYPIATAHCIGAELHRRSGLPWLADFRDPMAQDDYPTDPATWATYKRIEREAISLSRCSMFTTPSAVDEYRRRYPEHAARIQLLENGYDENSFASASLGATPATTGNNPRVLLHSGIVYPNERDPRQLLAALRLLHDEGTIQPGKLVVRLRAAVHDGLLQQLAQQYQVEPYVEFCPAVGYIDALREMMGVDGLLVLQAANCNQQVPAKLYEYLRAGRPILCLTDPAGDTATILRQAGVIRTARLDDAAEVAALIRHHLQTGGADLSPAPDAVTAASRANRTQELVAHLEYASRHQAGAA